MRKNYFLIGVFALATITFAACSSEDKKEAMTMVIPKS